MAKRISHTTESAKCWNFRRRSSILISKTTHDQGIMKNKKILVFENQKDHSSISLNTIHSIKCFETPETHFNTPGVSGRRGQLSSMYSIFVASCLSIVLNPWQTHAPNFILSSKVSCVLNDKDGTRYICARLRSSFSRSQSKFAEALFIFRCQRQYYNSTLSLYTANLCVTANLTRNLQKWNGLAVSYREKEARIPLIPSSQSKSVLVWYACGC